MNLNEFLQKSRRTVRSYTVRSQATSPLHDTVNCRVICLYPRGRAAVRRCSLHARDGRRLDPQFRPQFRFVREAAASATSVPARVEAPPTAGARPNGGSWACCSTLLLSFVQTSVPPLRSSTPFIHWARSSGPTHLSQEPLVVVRVLLKSSQVKSSQVKSSQVKVVVRVLLKSSQVKSGQVKSRWS